MEVCLHEDNQRWMDIKGLGDYIKTMLPLKWKIGFTQSMERI